MTLTGTSVKFEMLASAEAQSVNVSAAASIGTPSTSVAYESPGPDVAYALALQIAEGDVLTVNFATGAVTGTVAGANQVETQTIVAASGATTAGNLNVTVTANNLTGSPLTVPVALLLSDNTASLVAAKVRTALGNVAAITDKFTVGGTGANYSIADIAKLADDATRNLTHANDTSAGITDDSTSTHTTAGDATSLAYRINGTAWDQKDFEGVALPAMTRLYSTLLRSIGSDTGPVADVTWTGAGMGLGVPFVSHHAFPSASHFWQNNSVAFEATEGDILLYLDVHAGQ